MADATLTFGQVATAVGALGTAAFGLVDATKGMGGGVSHAGMTFIDDVVALLAPVNPADGFVTGSALTQPEIKETLKANWLNGMSLPDQKSVLKALVKIRLNAATAPQLAALTGVDASVLTDVAVKLSDGNPMTQPEMDAYGRFDLLLSTIIDRAYQKADQRYRTWAKLLAMCIAVILAEIGAYSLASPGGGAAGSPKLYLQALVVGLLATPLAPVAKDLSTALATAVKAVQSVRS